MWNSCTLNMHDLGHAVHTQLMITLGSGWHAQAKFWCSSHLLDATASRGMFVHLLITEESITRGYQLHVQRSYSSDVSFDHLLSALHLREQLRVTYDPCRILDLPAGLVKPGDDTNNGPLQYICQIRNPIEGHSPGPFIYHLDQSEAWSAHKVIRVGAGKDDLMLDLEGVDLLGDLDDGLFAFLQAWR